MCICCTAQTIKHYFYIVELFPGSPVVAYRPRGGSFTSGVGSGAAAVSARPDISSPDAVMTVAFAVAALVLEIDRNHVALIHAGPSAANIHMRARF